MRSSGPIGAQRERKGAGPREHICTTCLREAKLLQSHMTPPLRRKRACSHPREALLLLSPQPVKTLWHSVREFSPQNGTFPRKVYYKRPKSVRSTGPIGPVNPRIMGNIHMSTHTWAVIKQSSITILDVTIINSQLTCYLCGVVKAPIMVDI